MHPQAYGQSSDQQQHKKIPGLSFQQMPYSGAHPRIGPLPVAAFEKVLIIAMTARGTRKDFAETRAWWDIHDSNSL